MVRNDIVYFKKIYNIGADHFFTGVISFIYQNRFYKNQEFNYLPNYVPNDEESITVRYFKNIE